MGWQYACTYNNISSMVRWLPSGLRQIGQFPFPAFTILLGFSIHSHTHTHAIGKKWSTLSSSLTVYKILYIKMMRWPFPPGHRGFHYVTLNGSSTHISLHLQPPPSIAFLEGEKPFRWSQLFSYDRPTLPNQHLGETCLFKYIYLHSFMGDNNTYFRNCILRRVEESVCAQ